jgi:hypothetical protein
MPQLNQDFTRLEHDSFVLQFTAVDGTLNVGGNPEYAAWWGLVAGTSPTGTPDLQAWSNDLSPYAIGAYDASTTFCSLAATGLTPGASQINAAVGASTVTIQLSYADFSTLNDGDYYHELVLMKVSYINPNYTAHQCRSHVAATGILTIKESSFTNKPYR